MNCKHKYNNNTALAKQEKNECPYSKVYKELSTKEGFSTLNLPIDNEGLCIFHSRDIEWKIEHDFINQLFNLIEILKISGQKIFNFMDFVFVVGGNDIIEIKDIDNKKTSLDFTGAIFKSRIRLLGLNINNLILDNTVFEKSFSINKCSLFSSFNFERAKVKDKFYLHDTKVGFNSYFGNTKFLGLVKLSDSSFTGEFYFLKTVLSFTNISEYEEPYSEFINIEFHRSARFEKTVFDCGVEFSDITFKDNSEFLNTKFSNEYYTIFKSLNIATSLSFIGSEKEKLFPYKTSIDVNEKDILGQLIFENVYFKNIKEEHRNILKQLSYGEKVSIGSGCIKYRHQTDPKTIYISNNIQILLIEIINTYSTFFGEHNGFNLGFEILERENDKITFFYFSDENISEDVFLQRLQKTEVDFWSIIENPEIVYKAQTILLDDVNKSKQENNQDLAKYEPSTKLQKFVDKFLYAKDLLINMTSSFFKINARITHDKIKEQDLINLFKAIHFENSGVELNEKKIIQVIINNFNQKQIVNINKNNNLEIKGSNNFVAQDLLNSKINK